MTQRRSFAPRDQGLSGFSAPLGRLCDALPATAAAIVDRDGETVDYAGFCEPYQIRVAAAELQLLVFELERSRFQGWNSTRELIVRGRRGTFAAVRMTDGYSLIVQLGAYAFTMSQRALNEAIRELCHEGGLPLPERYKREVWSRLDVQDDATPAHRPVAAWLAREWTPVQVLGRYHGEELRVREVAYRVRLSHGEEAMLVRERFGRWYSDRNTLG